MVDKQKKRRQVVYFGLFLLVVIIFGYIVSSRAESKESEVNSSSVIQDVPTSGQVMTQNGVVLRTDQTNPLLPNSGSGTYESEGSDNPEVEVSEDIARFDEVGKSEKKESTEEDVALERRLNEALKGYEQSMSLSEKESSSEMDAVRSERDRYKELYEQGVIDRNAIIAGGKVDENQFSHDLKGEESAEITTEGDGRQNTSHPRPTVQVAGKGVVSSLSGSMSNNAFFGEVSKQTPMNGNAIPAVIEKEQIVRPGDFLRLRLTQPIVVDNLAIPAGEEVVGAVALRNSRLEVVVNSIRYKDNITPVTLVVYDLDGQRGITVGSTEAGKVADRMRQSVGRGVANAGTSGGFVIHQDAKSAILSELARGTIRTVADFITGRSEDVKVRVKPGHKVFLIEDK